MCCLGCHGCPCGVLVCGGGSAAHHQGGFVSLGVASAAPRFDGPKGVEASALGRETRNTQDNNYYHLRTTQRAFMQRVQRCTVLRVRAGAGEWRGPWQRRRESVRILARSAEGRGRSTGPVARPDSTLLSVLPFMDNSVCDGGDIHSEVSSQPSSRS